MLRVLANQPWRRDEGTTKERRRNDEGVLEIRAKIDGTKKQLGGTTEIGGGPKLEKRGNRKSSFRLLLVGVTLTLSVILVTGCGNGVTRFTIEGKDNLTFTPDTITIKTGQTVELTLVNNGKLPHTFTVPDLNLEVQMPPGETKQVTFTAPNAGEYRFFSGALDEFDTMKGKIIVQ